MRIALAQINLRVGDVAANAASLLAQAESAAAAGADLLVTPELALSGYPPEDLLLRSDFLGCCDAALHHLAARTPIPMLLGHPHRHQGRLYNRASLLARGGVQSTYDKRCLPNTQVFDEKRYFHPGDAPGVLSLGDWRLGILVCEDVWCGDWAPEPAALAGLQAFVVLNASPYHRGKDAERVALLADRARQAGRPILYLNLVGGQDELVFDGGSLVLDAEGQVQMRGPHCSEALLMVDLERDATGQARPNHMPAVLAAPQPLPEVYQALGLGLGDYVGKNGFSGVVLGLSGGIDSALTLAIAVDALGAERVHALILPSRYTAAMSVEDAVAECLALGVKYDIVPIEPLFQAYLQALAPLFGDRPPDTTEENLQARIRAGLLMAYSNKFGHLLLSTGNKSEIAVGYATLYGDMAGGFALIKDCPKQLVYSLARYRNEREGRPVIPTRVLERAPSAELAPDQTDQDSLPPYPVLDAIIQAFVEQGASATEITATGVAADTVARTLRLIQTAEYKRRQGAPGVRISPLAFGKDRRYPITNGFRSWAPNCAEEQ